LLVELDPEKSVNARKLRFGKLYTLFPDTAVFRIALL
jgi:hypothetical protein